jgi:tetratricopeptide (TPR) repeat protein
MHPSKRIARIFIIAWLILGAACLLHAEEKPLSPDQEESRLTAEVLLERASRAFENRQTEGAIYLFKKCLRYRPEYPEAHYRLGVAYAYENEFQKAIDEFRLAIKYRPDFAKAYINLGSAFGSLKKYKEALAFYQKALRLEEDNPRIYYNIASIYAAIGQKGLAEEYFAKAKELGFEEGENKMRE